MFLEGTRFAEGGLPNGSCLQGTPKYKICFGDMCSFYLLVKNQLFVFDVYLICCMAIRKKNIEEDASIKMFPQ